MIRTTFTRIIAIFCLCGEVVADDNLYKRCKVLSSLAEHVMTARQIGYPMSTLMDDMAGKGVDEVVTPLIIAAYEEPAFSTEALQQKSINDFRDLYHLECVKKVSARNER